MKYLIMTILSVNCIIGQCQTSLIGQWRFISYRNHRNGYIKTQPFSDYRYGSIMLAFQDSAGAGTFTGNTLSNTISGEYQIIDDTNILFSKVTRALFPERHEIIDIRMGLKGRTKYQIEENTLKIIFNNDQEELNFVRVSYDLEGIWKIKQITDYSTNNPNVSFDEKLRFEFNDSELRIYTVTDKKKSIKKEILQTNLFHKFEIETIKKSEISQKKLDDILIELFSESYKYEILSNTMHWHSGKYKIDLYRVTKE